MKFLFLTLALSLFSILHAEESNSSEGKFGGVYHLNAVIADEKAPDEETKTFSAITISQLDNGDLKIKFTMTENGKCKEIELILKKTDNSNDYIIEENFEHIHHVHVIATSVPDNWIFECKGYFNGKPFKIIKLLGPNTEVDPQAMKEYQDITNQERFAESTIFFPKEENCIPERD